MSALLRKKKKNVHFLSDFGLSVKKIVIIILMTNTFIKLSLNGKTLITSSSKEAAGTPGRSQGETSLFFIQTVGTVNVPWAESW